jgi:hypothetical protein
MTKFCIAYYESCFLRSPYSFLGLEISTATAESGWGFGFVFIISLFVFHSSIVLSLIILYYYFINTSFHQENKQLEMQRKEENLTENHTIPMVSDTDGRVQIDWQWPLSVVHSIMMVNSAKLGEDGCARPPPFTLSTPSTPSPAKLARYFYQCAPPCPSPLLTGF